MLVPEYSDLIKIIEKSLGELDTLLKELASDNSSKKRAFLIAQWLNNYRRYQKNEKSFDPTKLIRYKRGSIILVNFGYRIGCEIGGPHYSIVLDVNNNLNSNTITVIPATSLKETYKENRYRVKLKHGIYSTVNDKVYKLYIDLDTRIENLKKTLSTDHDQYESASIHQKIDKCKEDSLLLKQYVDKLQNLKKGTVLELAQITTISKQRIIEPINSKDLLYNLRISSNDLDVIENKLGKLFFHNQQE